MRRSYLLVLALVAGCGGSDDATAVCEDCEDSAATDDTGTTGETAIDSTTEETIGDTGEVDSSMTETSDDTGTVAETAAETSAETSSDAVSDARDAVADAADTAVSTDATDAVSDASDAVSDAPDAVSDAADASDARDAADVATDAVSDASDAVSDASDAADVATDTREACVPMTLTVTKSAGTAAMVQLVATDSMWNNASNAADASLTTYADAAVSGTNPHTRVLVLGTYGFALPTTAVINGISVEFTRTGVATGLNAGVQDGTFRLNIDATTRSASDKAKPDKWPIGVLTPVTYGGATDLWGSTWTAAKINAATFGVYMYAQRYISDADTARVANAAITVSYTVPCP